MKIAIILAISVGLTGPGSALAESTSGGSPDRSGHLEAVKMPHAAAGTPRAPNDSDRVMDAELRRIDRIMTICRGC